MKKILVIGVGRFGKHLAKTMLDLGNDIVIVDKNEEKVEALNDDAKKIVEEFAEQKIER